MAKQGYGTEYLEKDYGFDRLTVGKFEEFLRDLQEGSPYQWPNLYLAWEKPDGSLFMIGTNSTQMQHMIVHEIDREWWANQYREVPEYSSYLYGISPHVAYMENGERYDPVERLVSKVAGYQYVGSWEDPDVLMDDPHGFNRVLACGRWELAKEMIGISEVDKLIASSAQKANLNNETRRNVEQDSVVK